MTDTKKLIEQARKLAEIQREQAIVEKAIEVSLLPADPAPSNITPQDAFNETWDAIKKVNEVKANGNLKVQSISGQQVDLSGMDGSIDDKLLPSLKFIESTFETTANVNTKLATKQDTLTKTLTLHWDDGTSTDVKVG